MKQLFIRLNAATVTALLFFGVASASAQGTITPAGTFPVNGNTFDLITDSKYQRAYTTDASQISAWSLSNPTSPQLLGSVSVGGASTTKLYTSGNYLYATGANYLQIFKISQGKAPLIRMGSIQTDGPQPDSVAVKGDYAYVTNWAASTAQPKVQVYNIADKTAPVLVSSLGANSDALKWPATIAIKNKYAYVTSNSNGKLNVFNIDDPANPVAVATLQLQGAAEIAFNGNYAYVSGINSNAINVVNIRRPSAPFVAGTIVPPSQNTQYPADPANIDIVNDELYVDTIDSFNFSILSYNLSANPTQPPLDQTFGTNGEDPAAIADLNNILYVITNVTNGPSKGTLNMFTIAP